MIIDTRITFPNRNMSSGIFIPIPFTKHLKQLTIILKLVISYDHNPLAYLNKILVIILYFSILNEKNFDFLKN